MQSPSSKPSAPVLVPEDPRHIVNGLPIPGETYCDQPYIVQTDDGTWLCVMTTGPGEEGKPGQKVITVRSTDNGKTWSPPIALEPPGTPENSYAVLLKTPFGRVYCFYNFNIDNLREVHTETGGVFSRVDSLGAFVFRYSDDGGKSWSKERYPVPVREFACDRENVYAGKVRFFWNVGRPLTVEDATYIPLHKVGAMGEGFFAQSEGAFLKSRNILTERDAANVCFETLPEGDSGLRTPPGGGRIAEEQSLTTLSDGTLYCVYRSVDGHPVCAYSRDGGYHWTLPQYKTYAPNGRRVKHPRAANFVWRCTNGKYLYWFHNHAPTAAMRNAGWEPYADRNPAWLSCGEEIETPDGIRLTWSQPEILLFDDNPAVRMSYPDLVEQNGEFYITETQKTVGRTHRIAPELLAGLFGQSQNRTTARNGLSLELPQTGKPIPAEVPMPRLPDLLLPSRLVPDTRAGFTLEITLKLDSLQPGQTILDNRSDDGRGFTITVAEKAALHLKVCDGRTVATWDSDAGLLRVGERHSVSVIVDGGPKLILFVIDGVLCDGGEERQFGWGRYSPHLRSANGSPTLRIAPMLQGRVELLRVYHRALRVSEVVGNHRAALESVP